MKHILFLLFVATAITACKKETKANSTFVSNSMTYDIDSVYNEGDGSHSVQYLLNDSIIDIICLENGLSYLDLNLPQNITIGTFQFDSTYSPTLVYSDDVFNDSSYPINGAVIISYHDVASHTIKGSFYATVKQHDTGTLRVITNGQFQGHY